MSIVTGLRCGVVACPACALVAEGFSPSRGATCRRCGCSLRLRKTDSVARTWALLIAATLAYIPANVLPILHTSTLLGDRSDTVLSGVMALWDSGSWDLAFIVFLASVVIPLAKIACLALLLLSIQLGWSGRCRERTELYRLVHWIGPWSMLDIFVIVLLVALVQFAAMARVDPGPGAIAFGAMVVLTMMAAQSFDPRLMWDAAAARESAET